MTEASQNPNQQRVPAWVGVALIVVCFVAGGAFIWWVIGSPLTGGSDFIPDPNHTAPNRPRVAFRPPPNPESIRKTAAGYVAHADGTVMNVETIGGHPVFAFRYMKPNLIPQDVQDVLIMKFRVLQDDAVAQHIGLTSAQREKLSRISTNLTALHPSQAERQKLESLWQEYASGKNKAQAEKNLLATLKQVGNDNLAATRKSAQARADEIKSILSADQIKKFQDMNNGG